MEWFNYIGVCVALILMTPTMIYATRRPQAFENSFKNKPLTICEQAGRYGALAFMCFNVPYLSFDILYDRVVYVAVTGGLCLVYCVLFALLISNGDVLSKLALSVLPSLVLLAAGIITLNVPLLVFTAVFAPCHVAVSLKNAQKKPAPKDGQEGEQSHK